MHDRITRLVRKGIDLSSRQFFVLGECFHEGERTVKQLHDKGQPGLDKPAITRAVDRLSTLGHVVRREHPVDRRSVLVVLTPAGRRFYEALQKA